MRLRTLLLVVLAVTIIVPAAHGQRGVGTSSGADSRWYLVTVSGDVEVYLDLQRSSGFSLNHPSVWVRWDYAVPQQFERSQPASPGNTYTSFVQRASFDCERVRRQSHQVLYYDHRGSVVESSEITTSWMEYAPETIGETVLTRVCAYLRSDQL